MCHRTCCWFYIDFISFLFLDTITSTLFHELITALCTLFPCFILASLIEHKEDLSFAYRSWKICMWVAVIFVTDCISVCILETKNSGNTVSPGENVWSVGLYSNLFLTNTCCCYFGKISLQMKTNNATVKSWLR